MTNFEQRYFQDASNFVEKHANDTVFQEVSNHTYQSIHPLLDDMKKNGKLIGSPHELAQNMSAHVADRVRHNVQAYDYQADYYDYEDELPPF